MPLSTPELTLNAAGHRRRHWLIWAVHARRGESVAVSSTRCGRNVFNASGRSALSSTFVQRRASQTVQRGTKGARIALLSSKEAGAGKLPNVMITGASAGVGRSITRRFAVGGFNVGLIGRHEGRLREAEREVQEQGGRALVLPADVSDAAAMTAAAERFEAEIGPIDVWVNCAMVTILAPVTETTIEEFMRVTAVTYLGTVNGTKAALSRMLPRGSGVILQVGSALSYRSIPLQSAYCGAKSAVVGFTDSLRSELLHEGVDISLVTVHLPAVNTPQFDWARNKMGRRPQPVPPIFDPDHVADQVFRAAMRPAREYWIGLPAAKAILSYELAPWLGDRILAKNGYDDQLTDEAENPGRPDNLFETVPGLQGAHGRFRDRTAKKTPILISPASRQAAAAFAAAIALIAAFGLGAFVF